MALTTGTRIGPYEVAAQIGAGGMGEVYRATDTNLARQVAIKVLPESMAADAERLARFDREARTLAALNHPNIAAIYGLERSHGQAALVMELVEGPTLADRIAQGPIPLDETLAIARQIAEGLEAAHEQGIIHRDLKPANIKIKDDGTVKVLDFGLAKLAESGSAIRNPASESARAAASLSPTITSPALMTGVGVLLGTAAYMSPEQAKGKPADKRSDIWAFGCVLYEMIAGRRAFEGEDIGDTLAAVLKSDPDWTLLPRDVPHALGILLRRCLAKDRRQRVSEIATAKFTLSELSGFGGLDPRAATSAIATSVNRPSLWRYAVLAATLLGGSALTGAVVWFATQPAPVRVLRATITLGETQTVAVSLVGRDFSVSPDATHIVYAGNNGLFVRALDQLDPRSLGGLGFPVQPFFSPNGEWIGFADGVSLKKVSVTGGPPLALSRLDGNLRGATWGEAKSIIFATTNSGTGLWRVDEGGGDPVLLTRPNRERGETDHVWPEFLPGGRTVLFTIVMTAGGIDNSQIAALDLRTGTQTILMRGGSHAHYVPTGHLVYGAAGTLWAVAFNLDELKVAGTPRAVLPQVLTTQLGAAGFDVARDGMLVYAPGGAQIGARTLVWVDRGGRETSINAPPRAYTYPRISPDGRQVALDIRDQEGDIWTWDFTRATLTRVTFDATLDRAPVWSRDGKQLFFSSDRDGAANLYYQLSASPGAVERLTQSPYNQFATGVTPDGMRVVYWEQGPTRDIMLLTLEKNSPSSAGLPQRPSQGSEQPLSGTLQPLVQTPFNELNGEISPDGRWLAYQADDSGQDEVYVRPFPAVGPPVGKFLLAAERVRCGRTMAKNSSTSRQLAR